MEKKTFKGNPTVCAILWLLLTNRGILSDAVKIPCHKYEIKGLRNYFERGERGGGGVLERASKYGSEVLCIHFLSRYHKINKLL